MLLDVKYGKTLMCIQKEITSLAKFERIPDTNRSNCFVKQKTNFYPLECIILNALIL